MMLLNLNKFSLFRSVYVEKQTCRYKHVPFSLTFKYYRSLLISDFLWVYSDIFCQFPLKIQCILVSDVLASTFSLGF